MQGGVNNCKMVPRGGFEPPALGLEVLCSIHLSYQGMTPMYSLTDELAK